MFPMFPIMTPIVPGGGGVDDDEIKKMLLAIWIGFNVFSLFILGIFYMVYSSEPYPGTFWEWGFDSDYGFDFHHEHDEFNSWGGCIEFPFMLFCAINGVALFGLFVSFIFKLLNRKI